MNLFWPTLWFALLCSWTYRYLYWLGFYSLGVALQWLGWGAFAVWVIVAFVPPIVIEQAAMPTEFRRWLSYRQVNCCLCGRLQPTVWRSIYLHVFDSGWGEHVCCAGSCSGRAASEMKQE